MKYCSAVNSGSSANLLAFMALTSPLLGERRVLPGDEVITVAAGFPTTVTPMLQYGAVPVFVDVTIPQYNIDTDRLEEAFSLKTKAVMIAHTLGNPFDLKKVKDFCDRHDLWLVEDNCDALGSRYCIMLYYIRSFVPFVTGDGTVYALPDGIICVDTGLMGSMENYPWATIINMSTPILVIILK